MARERSLRATEQVLRQWSGEEVMVGIEATKAAAWIAGIENVTLTIKDVDGDAVIERIAAGFIDYAGKEVATLILEEGILAAEPRVSDDAVTVDLAEVVVTIERHDGSLAAARRRRAAAAKRIDPWTAHAWVTYGQMLDPYGDGHLPPDQEQRTRLRWMWDPDERFWVVEHDVRVLHPETPSEEWQTLFAAALAREHEEGPEKDYL